MRLESGGNYTGKMFNKDLKQLLSPYVDYSKGTVSSHSFRSGLASLMATLGYSDQEIMTIGRWKSDAFLEYIKMDRIKRCGMAKELAQKILSGNLRS